MKKYCPDWSREFRPKNPEVVTDWKHDKTSGELNGIGLNGLQVWSDWYFSPSKLVFKVVGGNSNGEEWECWYRAVETTNNYESHTFTVIP